jgi:hypothetical protein
MANTVINTPELLNLDSATGATVLAKGTISERPTTNAINGALRFNTDTNKTEYFDGTGWYEIVDEYASGFIGPATNYFDTKLYTGNGATQSIGGYINGSASFNGSSSKIVTGLTLPADSSMSFSLWFKTATTGVNQSLFGETDSSFSNLSIRIGLWWTNANTIYVWIANGSSQWYTTLAGVSYLDDNWHNFVLSINGTSVKLYADGSQTPIIDATSSVSFGTTGVTPLTIGAPGSAYSGYFWTGSVDQVRIYDTALSSSDVTAIYGETAATATTAAFPSGQTAIATYTMDTSANGLLNTQDLSTVNYPAGAGCIALYEMNGNSNDTSGTYNGTPANITYEGGAFDKAAVFGSSSNILLPSNLISGTTDSDYSVSLWVKFDTLPGANFVPLIGQLSNTSAFRLLLYHNSGSTYNVGLMRTFGGTYYYNSPNTAIQGTFNVGQYYNVIVTYQSSNKLVNGYLNGNSIGSYTLNTTGSGAAGAIALGTYNGTTSYSFDGSLDQVRIFNTVLTQSQVTTLARGIATSYSGTATNVNFNGHLDFAPDFTWIKAREAAHDHVLVNSINGAGSNQGLSSNATYYNGQYTATYGYISSLNSNGFTVSAGSSYANYTNVNNEDYVSWNWKGGGTAVQNTQGSTTSDVSANKDSGFSIVKYTGAGDVNVGHGLLEAPNLIISKITNVGGDWVVYNSISGTGKYLVLNDTASIATASEVFSAVTDTTFTHNWSGNSYSYIAYCWHSVAGYSKIGTFLGTGTTTGNVVTVGFEPRFLLVKSTTYAGTNWIILDKARTPNNPMENDLNPNLANAEQTGTGNNYPQATTTSTTFQCNTTDGSINSSGQTYIYLAIA